MQFFCRYIKFKRSGNVPSRFVHITSFAMYLLNDIGVYGVHKKHKAKKCFFSKASSNRN